MVNVPRSPLLFASLVACFLVAASAFSTPRRVGDGGEYMVMARQLARFRSPAPTREELERAKAELRDIGGGFESSLLDYPTLVGADGRQPFLHFWLYPLIAVPGVWLAQLFNAHANVAFTVTNIALLTGAAYIAARWAPWIAAVYLFASPIIWWVDKAHTEVFLFATAAIAALCVERWRSLAFVSFALAGAQNAALGVVYPLFVAAAAMISPTRPRLARREWIAAVAGAALVAAPLAYYYSRLGTPTPMAAAAYFSIPTPFSLLAFVVEPNIGLLVNAPAYAVALATVVVVGASRRPYFGRLWWSWSWAAPMQLALLLLWSQNPNANHGGTPGVNRWVLSLLPLSVPWISNAFGALTDAPRRIVACLIVAAGVYSLYAHLPNRPESYLAPTKTALTLWRYGWLEFTSAEVFAERLSGREAPTLPVADNDCAVVLTWDMQWPIPCVPPDAEFPGTCQGIDAFCAVSQRGAAARVSRAHYNGFFYQPARASWPAAGPLAQGIRSVLLSIEPAAQRWDVARARDWVAASNAAEVAIVLQRGRSLFVHVSRTASLPSLILTGVADSEIAVHTLVPARRLSTTATSDSTIELSLPADASNLAITVASRVSQP